MKVKVVVFRVTQTAVHAQGRAACNAVDVQEENFFIVLSPAVQVAGVWTDTRR